MNGGQILTRFSETPNGPTNMTPLQLSWQEQIKVNTAIAHHTNEELALGFLRYEALRKVSPRQFSEFHGRNLAGENFDDMITRLAFQKS